MDGRKLSFLPSFLPSLFYSPIRSKWTERDNKAEKSDAFPSFVPAKSPYLTLDGSRSPPAPRTCLLVPYPPSLSPFWHYTQVELSRQNIVAKVEACRDWGVVGYYLKPVPATRTSIGPYVSLLHRIFLLLVGSRGGGGREREREKEVGWGGMIGAEERSRLPKEYLSSGYWNWWSLPQTC